MNWTRAHTVSVENAPVSTSCDRTGAALVALCGAFASGGEWAVPGDFSDADWGSLVELARRHGLTPLLYRAIGGVGRSRIPAELCESLKKHYVVQTARNLRAVQRLEEIGQALRGTGVGVVVLKGASSIRRLYEDVGCRTMVDIDLMVRRESTDEFQRVMKGLGYRCPLAGSLPAPMWVTTEMGYRFPFEKPGCLPMDVHTDVLDGRDARGLATREMWARARPIATDGSLLFLNSAHFLLHSATHYMKHRDFDTPALSWMVDVLLAARKWGAEIDWPVFWEAAKRWGMANDAATVMATLSRHWGVRVPLLPKGATPLSALALVSTAPAEAGRRAAAFLSRCSRRLLKVRRLPSVRARLHFFRFLLFPPTENMRHRYGIPQGRTVWPWYPWHLTMCVGRLLRGLAAWAWLSVRRVSR